MSAVASGIVNVLYCCWRCQNKIILHKSKCGYARYMHNDDYEQCLEHYYESGLVKETQLTTEYQMWYKTLNFCIFFSDV